SGSVALLADTIHNVGDAVTAIPLWIAFQLVRRKATDRFTYGLGRVEDLAGISIVAIILSSALVALYQAIERLVHPQEISHLSAVAAAGLVGFLGNEAVAIFRIKVAREIDSAALIADGYHARTDGFTSLAVVLGAAGVWFGYPFADPVIGLLITLAIFAIVWQSSKTVFTRMLDGVEPGVIAEIKHAVDHVAAVSKVLSIRARWLGHRLMTELDVAVAGDMTVREADAVSAEIEAILVDHVPALAAAQVRVRAADGLAPSSSVGHHHAPDPVPVAGNFVQGVVEIVNTEGGERMRFTPTRLEDGSIVSVVISRPGSDEVLALASIEKDPRVLQSRETPAEPHEFSARLIVKMKGYKEILPFKMTESGDRGHY
ncbi:MAG: cation diffusion facilitator family transporter, partial [Methanomicrobiales archaeon]|nr:cation diffusion facilitator family transporter [Methanomicrobiales archaeon]